MESDKVKNYAYYEKLGFGNFKSWSKEDLSGFLIFDSLNISAKTVDDEYANEKSFLDAQNHKIQKYNKNKLLLNIFDWLFLKLYLKGNNSRIGRKKMILFEGSKYPILIFEAKKHYQVKLVVSGKEDRLFAIKNFIGYLNINDLDPLFLNYVEEKNIKYLHLLVEKMEKKLKMVMPDYIVLCMDMLILERAIILAAKKLGIPTLVVQHGMCDLPTCGHDFKVADYVLVWGKYFKDLCIKQCKRISKDVFILGYPYFIGNNKKVNNKRFRVCYLGQDLEAGNKDFLKIKIETICRLSKICDKLGLDFVYRPHPRREEKNIIKHNLAGIFVIPKSESLEQTFRKSDIFISFNSTALVEATMRSKISLQLMNYPIQTDNLEILGACSKSFPTIEELQLYLAKMANMPNIDRFKSKLNNDYAEIKYNLGKHFLKIIEKINEIREN